MTRDVVIPRTLSRRARAAYFAAALVANDEGVVEGGQTTLMLLLDLTDQKHLRGALDELEAARLVVRVGNTSKQVVRVLVLSAFSPPSCCEVCGAEPAKLRGAKRCPACIQVKRREWKADLIRIWMKGKTMGWSDEKIAYTAHARIRRTGIDGVPRSIPLWGGVPNGTSTHGKAKQRETQGEESIVNAGVALGLFPESLAQFAAYARDGDSRSDDGEGIGE